MPSLNEDVDLQLDGFPLWASSQRIPRRYPFSPVNAITAKVPSEARPAFCSNTPQARFFRHPDLLTKLFDYFRKRDYTPEDRRQLLGFMLIHKASFHYPSQVLWSRVGRRFASALVHLLDIDVWDHDLKRVLKGWSFLSVLKRNKARLASHIMWQKFLYYADAIHWIDASTFAIEPGTIALLTCLLPQSDPTLFRSLRQLRWTESSNYSNDLLYMLGPTLDELQLQVYDFYDGTFNSFVFSDWTARIFHATSHLCPHVRFLSLGGMGPIIRNPFVISYFGSLHQATITQRAFNLDEDVVAPPTSFQALENLELVSYQAANSLIRSLPYVIPAMGNTLRSVYIQSISITSTLDTPGFIDNFYPLFHLNQLTHVYINFALLDFRFTDKDLVDTAKAWPCIIEMGFAFGNVERSPVPRLETLGVVATNCRFLTKITLPYVIGPNGDTTFKISAPPLHPLREIRIHGMSWDSKQNTAINLALQQAFPNIYGVFDSAQRDEQRELDQAVLPPYILCSRIRHQPATSVPRNSSVW